MVRTKKKKKASSTGFFPVFFRRLKLMLLVGGAFLLGMWVAGGARWEKYGIELLRYKTLFPASVRFFLPGGRAVSATAAVRETLSGRIIEVYDGDTATLLSPDGTRKYKIRFFGIDAPEAAQSFGLDSREALRAKILGREVKVQVMNTDPYGRTVGKVLLGDRGINLEMVREGYAWYYAAYARGEHDLEEAQAVARRNGLGLWGSSDPQPPWEYRHKKQRTR